MSRRRLALIYSLVPVGLALFLITQSTVGIGMAVVAAIAPRLYRWLKLRREEKERVFDYAGM